MAAGPITNRAEVLEETQRPEEEEEEEERVEVEEDVIVEERVMTREEPSVMSIREYIGWHKMTTQLIYYSTFMDI